jgi:hypothetical protein
MLVHIFSTHERVALPIRYMSQHLNCKKMDEPSQPSHPTSDQIRGCAHKVDETQALMTA